MIGLEDVGPESCLHTPSHASRIGIDEVGDHPQESLEAFITLRREPDDTPPMHVDQTNVNTESVIN